MAFTYTRSQLLSDINVGIRGKIGVISNQGDFVNRVVRELKSEIPLRSAKRKQQITPGLFSNQYQYALPSDLADQRIIDLPAQTRRYDGSFGIVPVEQFNTRPEYGDIAFDDHNGIRTLLVKSSVSGQAIVLDNFSTDTGWAAFGDAENIESDGDDYINGNGSVRFDISAAAGTTAGLQKNITSVDITEHLAGTSAVFVWVRITSTTGLTNFVLRLGSDSSNYYSKTVTTRADGNAFEVGWNLLRFDLTSLTTTGTVVDAAINYAALFMTKLTSKVSEVNYKFNYLVLMKGFIHNIVYYSNYGWVNSSGAWIPNSTDSLDLLTADHTEYELFVKKGIHLGMPLANFDVGERNEAKAIYDEAKLMYMMNNPDESLVMTNSYHE